MVMKLYLDHSGAYICQNLLNATLKNGNFYFGSLIFKNVWLVKKKVKKILKMERIHIETIVVAYFVLILNVLLFVF